MAYSGGIFLVIIFVCTLQQKCFVIAIHFFASMNKLLTENLVFFYGVCFGGYAHGERPSKSVTFRNSMTLHSPDDQHITLQPLFYAIVYIFPFVKSDHEYMRMVFTHRRILIVLQTTHIYYMNLLELIC